MSDDATMAPAVDTTPIDSIQAPAGTSESLSVNQAAKALADVRWKKNNPAESANEPATAAPESEAQAEDASPEEVTSETQANDQALPPIEPPRSWTKEEKDRWASYPREAQEAFARVEQGREREFLRSQQEAAEARKAADAEQAKWKQEREQYTAKQSAYTQALERTLQSEFGDIQTMDDVRKLQSEDPFRFQQWQLRQMELGQAKAEQQANEQRTAQERMSNWQKFTKEESDAFENEVPEFKAKKDEYTKRAAEVLSELGFSNDELGKLASGEEGIKLFDRRMQRLLFDRIKLSEIKAAVPKAMPKPVPPVQRPGISSPPGAAKAQDLRTLSQKLEQTGSVKDAVALLMARRKAS